MPFAYVILGVCKCRGLLATSQYCPVNEEPKIVCSECDTVFRFGKGGRFERVRKAR